MAAINKKDRDDLTAEIYDTFTEVASNEYASNATNCLMKTIDKYVEDAVIKARLEVMKNFGAI